MASKKTKPNEAPKAEVPETVAQSADSKEQIDDLREQVLALSKQLETKYEEEGGVDAALDAVTLLEDPYDVRNPMKIKEHPEGKRLSWKNASYRENRAGWKGWNPVTWDSEIGKAIEDGKYLAHTPMKFKASENATGYVMRGVDTILCWIDETIYNARMHNLTARTNAQAAASTNLNLPGRPGVQEIGEVTVQRGSQ